MLDRRTIERAFRKNGDAPLVVALSGGGDSVALLHLLVEGFGAVRIRALIVDHGLRGGSAADAARAHGSARALGVAGDILKLNWPHGPKRAQQAARRARYAALCDAARALGASVIALGHTADDQAETVLMRAANGSRWRGLAGMSAFAPAPVWPEGRGVFLARPLLAVRRVTLRAYLKERDASWIEDPANANPAFERVRMRAKLAEMEERGFDPMRLAGLARKLGALAEKVDEEALVLIAQAARFDAGRIEVNIAAWRGEAEARRRALAVLIMAVAGGERAPDAAAVEQMEASFVSGDLNAAALAGAVLRRKDQLIRVERDRGAVRGRADGPSPLAPLPLDPNRENIWDGRLALTAPAPGWRVEAAEDGGPIFASANARLPAAEAADFKPSWLLKDHVNHLLGRH